MSESRKKSKHQSDSESSESSNSSNHSNHKSKEKSKWDSPRRQGSSVNHRERDRKRDRSRSKDRDRHRNDDKKYERRRSPERDRRDRDRRDRDRDDKRRHSRHRSHSRSRERDYRRREGDRDRERNDRDRGGYRKNRRRDEEDDGNYEWGRRDIKRDPDEKQVEKEKPNFGLSGKLTEETNKVHGVVIKYAEPPEAKKPKRRWRLYPFKGETSLPVLYIHRQSGYLIGRDRKICDIAVDHPSCSKQHAALQYRLVPYEREDGSVGKRVRPYIIDLESANGTYVNNNKIESKKYIELLEKDVIKFGYSSREYVLLHESSKEEAEGDDDFDEENAEEEVKVKTEKVEDEN
ncbi:hypothetical protein PVAND_012150 [Polypedilum vanderplanki]|uniref:FHA domain-containing protein n=1 Tax=Polypedilum vanderplanki TaxID=319348 RepID=A0A9J6CKR4_POLVA|nr:hypothetical protein PVAND_012150 [Polypedilum vanderplanki]